MMRKRPYKKTLLFFFIFTIGFMIYYYPMQRICAEVELGRYLEKQGIHKDNIESKRAHKDYKQNGYFFNISLYDDPGIIYEYNYYFLSRAHEETFHIYCVARKNGTVLPYRLTKYPPIH